MTRHHFIRFAAFATASLATVPAFAHHPMGGETPETAVQGLLSGIGHPVLGLDHLAFIVAVGIAAVLAGSRFVLPLAFIALTLAGTGLHLMAVDLPLVEPVIALSVLAVGAMLASGRAFPVAAYAALFAVAGLFHGFAYGEAIFGAEATPLVAYLAGFGLTQYAIAVLVGTAVIAASRASTVTPTARLAGAVVMGMGLMIVGNLAIGAAFPLPV
ncbi:HupE/UreJ family protein [Rhizobiaceae bacterium]|nr:HupE/UreJ family protein [Rhizobiaceae bacterium]